MLAKVIKLSGRRYRGRTPDRGNRWARRTYQVFMTIPIRGTAALVVAAAIVAATAIWMPAYRWFLLISICIGAAVAGGLYLWHTLHPVKDDDVENKRPLGLR
jgi:fatty acid desaturase